MSTRTVNTDILQVQYQFRVAVGFENSVSVEAIL